MFGESAWTVPHLSDQNISLPVSRGALDHNCLLSGSVYGNREEPAGDKGVCGNGVSEVDECKRKWL